MTKKELQDENLSKNEGDTRLSANVSTALLMGLDFSSLMATL